MKKISWVFLVMVLLVSLCYFPTQVFAAWSINLDWDDNTEADLAGYRIYKRLSGETYDYGKDSAMKIWEGVPSECTVEISEAEVFLVATAFDQSGNESGPSNEVKWDKVSPAPPDGFLLKLWNLVLRLWKSLRGGTCLVLTDTEIA